MKYNSRGLSRLGQSGAIFGMSAPEMREQYNLKILSADMSVPAGLDRYKNAYPDDFYNVGIAEQNLLGVSAGLASEGFKVVAEAQAAFITMRCFEQVRQYMGYMQFPIVTVGINAGFALTYFGNTHYAIEDISLMRSIPNLTVLSPADAGEAVKCFEAALALNQPCYIRLTGGLMNPVVYPEDFDYRIGVETKVVDYGTDVTIFATGSMVYNSMKVAKMLSEEGIMCRVVDIHTLKPLDYKTIDRYLGCKLVVTVEEHSVIGGLSSIVSEYVDGIRVLNIGVQDRFSQPGDYEYLLDQNGLSVEKIAERIRQEY
jgi:transketolase